jgi:hypothetical protein
MNRADQLRLPKDIKNGADAYGLVVTLETAKKLKAARFPQKTFFAWDGDGIVPQYADPDLAMNREIFAAPTAQEIADELPIVLRHSSHLRLDRNEEVVIPRKKTRQVWTAAYGTNGPREHADTMAEAWAALWLKLRDDAA